MEKINQFLDSWFEPIVRIMEKILFWDLFKSLGIDIGVTVPFIIVWLVAASIYFTIKLKFINIRGFTHSIRILVDKSNLLQEGSISPLQALSTAISGTVGLGNIAGVAVAISIGGPGATFWMIIAGFLGMSTKFLESTLAVKYRSIDKKGNISGGPMYYMEKILEIRNLKFLSRFLPIIFSFFLIISSFGAGNMFQSNQAFAHIKFVFPNLSSYGLYFGILLALVTGVVVIGGIRSIARLTSKLVPVMSILYIGASLVIISINFSDLGEAFKLIFVSAFLPKGMAGGFVGVMIQGMRRAVFSNEAGIGSSPIVHSTAKTDKPIKEGFVALLEPFLDTVVICTMTALVIIVTGFYNTQGEINGAELTSAAYGSVFSWFPYILLVAIILFAFSSLISWSYYGLQGYNYFLTKFLKIKNPSSKLYYLFFLSATILGSTIGLQVIVDFSDMLFFTLAIPNIIVLIIASSEVKRDMADFMKDFRKRN